jgi:hypothetical protein
MDSSASPSARYGTPRISCDAHMAWQLSDAGVVGLCPAGRILALRLAAMGLRVSLCDASPGCVEEFVVRNAGARGGLVGYTDSEDFIESLNAPRRIVVFEMATGSASAALRSHLLEPDRLLQYSPPEDDVPLDDLALLEATLLFQLG